MRIYSRKNVLEAALDRIRWIFDEFENIVVDVSGGKDSTVVFHLALQVAKEKGRLPLKVMFLDQEAEWQATIDTVRDIMERPEVEPLWYQIPFRLFNATSSVEHWLMCWDPADEARWMRPKEPYAITENVYGTDRFAELFEAILAHDYAGKKVCHVAGVRCEESPSRMLGITSYACYKWATWGRKHKTGKGQHFTLYPIYDWSYTDIWKAIHENGWPYNPIYDAQYAYGIPVLQMRVSNVHHETAVGALFYMQEVEPDTYVRLTQRIAGIDMAGKMNVDDYFPKELPFMFNSWVEYRDHLLANLIDNPQWRERFAKEFGKQDDEYLESLGDKLAKAQIRSILTNDHEMVKINNFRSSPRQYEIRKANRRKREAAAQAAIEAPDKESIV